jgi:hypothetical protein
LVAVERGWALTLDLARYVVLNPERAGMVASYAEKQNRISKQLMKSMRDSAQILVKSS